MKPLLLQNYDVFLFDLDDTLFDHSGAYKRGVDETLQNFPILAEINQTEFFHTFTKHNHLLWSKFALKEINFEEFSIMRLNNTLMDFNITADSELLHQMVKGFQTSYLQQISPQHKTIQFLSRLSREIQVGIVTNGTVFNVYDKIERLALTNIFPESSVIVSERIGIFKPHKGIFQHSLDLFKVEASRTLFIGDNYFTDISGANSVGMETLWINRHDYVAPGEVQPDITVKGLLDMEGLIFGNEKREPYGQTTGN
ncbi:HAD family hydrolase [Rossellomorea aquimaris]|uniref:HAD family hydrolase n=1 Tax=Rossellomorea TaxID=2837508 RepID=UPI001CD6D5D2|nr:HAD family hydrolase [Rossellomorea aquimaris]MCA1058784.1 HAD family hydrolase [Rossellomorea aquimaris]